MPKFALIIFVKVPIAGLVKTRLAQTSCLNDNEVALLAEAMFKDTLVSASQSYAEVIEIGFYPNKGFSKISKIVDIVRTKDEIQKPINYLVQSGSNFDERFSSVVRDSFENKNEYLIVLGADLPYIDPSTINTAFHSLGVNKNKKRIVLGPAGGGGIYLVGITKKFSPNWFNDYELFRGGVEMSQFVKFCSIEQFELDMLHPLMDIDIEEDLVSLISFLETKKVIKHYYEFHFPKYSAEIIDDLGLYIEEVPGKTRQRKIRRA